VVPGHQVVGRAVTAFALGEANRALALLKGGGLTGSGVLVPDRVS
jgi:hypothetical protein